MAIPINIETERLILRSVNADDVGEQYLGWLNDPEVTRFLETVGCPDLNTLRDYVDATLALDNVVFAAIIEPQMGYIGNIKLGPIDRRHNRADIGIMIGAQAAWGQGFAEESITALSRFAFGSLDMAKLFAGAHGSNRASIRSFEKAGFDVEGIFKSHVSLDGTRDDVVMLGLVNPSLAWP